MKKARIATLAVAAVCVALLLQGCYEEQQIVMMQAQPILITQQDVINMAKSGAPDLEIVREIRESGTVFLLSASDVENLKKEGVSEEVINCMLSTREAPPAMVVVQRPPVVVYDPWWGWDYAYAPGYYYYPAHLGLSFSYARFGGRAHHYGYGVHFGHWR